IVSTKPLRNSPAVRCIQRSASRLISARHPSSNMRQGILYISRYPPTSSLLGSSNTSQKRPSCCTSTKTSYRRSPRFSTICTGNASTNSFDNTTDGSTTDGCPGRPRGSPLLYFGFASSTRSCDIGDSFVYSRGDPRGRPRNGCPCTTG